MPSHAGSHVYKEQQFEVRYYDRRAIGWHNNANRFRQRLRAGWYWCEAAERGPNGTHRPAHGAFATAKAAYDAAIIAIDRRQPRGRIITTVIDEATDKAPAYWWQRDD